MNVICGYDIAAMVDFHLNPILMKNNNNNKLKKKNFYSIVRFEKKDLKIRAEKRRGILASTLVLITPRTEFFFYSCGPEWSS
jgi:hypothetical protein